MKKYFDPACLPWLTLGAGGLGFLLRLWLYSTGVDEKGLLVEGHLAGMLVFALTGLYLLALLLCVRNLKPVKKVGQLFPASLPGAIGCWVGAVGLAWAGIREFTQSDSFLRFPLILVCLVGALALVYFGLCRMKHLKPMDLAHVPVLLSMILLLISHYRIWSAHPQLQDYFFALMAGIFLMLNVYHRAAVRGKASGQRWHVFCNQAALFFCCTCLKGENLLFYLTMAVWTATDLCRIRPVEEDI